jgi:hypothetical protein
MYSTIDRTSWLRALAAFDHGDRRGLLRLYEAWYGGTGEDDGASSFAYYATWCADVRASPTDRTDDFDAYLDVALDAGVRDPGSLGVAAAVAPCVFWPAQPSTWQVPPETTGVPTLILASTVDPVTPASAARAILSRLPDARLIETRGGGHGSIGAACPNERMAAFVIEGQLPVADTSTCLGEVIDPFIPLARSPAVSAADAVTGVIGELIAHPQVLAWDGVDVISVGCADGGVATLEGTGDGWRTTTTLRDCAWATNGALDGSGSIDLVTWEADMSFQSARGHLRLRSDGDAWHLTGVWDDQPVDEDL